MTETPESLLATARDAVRLNATAMRNAFFANDHAITKKADRTLVTATDTEAEQAMRALIAERHPNHDILGEEFGESTGYDGAHEYRWVIDPLDGTSNFVLGLPLFVSAAAVLKGNQPVAAAVYHPILDDLYSAAVGQGAWLNDRRLAIEPVDELRSATIGFTRRRDAEIPTGTILDLIEANAATFRVLGSGIFTISQVAAGHLNAVIALKQHLWDVLPGLIIAQEAGATAVMFDGSPWTQQSEELILAHPTLTEKIVELFRAQPFMKE